MATASPTISSDPLPSKNSKFSFLKSVDLPVLFLSGGFLVAFAFMALFDLKGLTNLVNHTFALSTKFFGAYWQVLLLANFFIALYLGFSRYGHVKLGHLAKPEMSTFRWMSVIMCTLLAGGGVFWAAAEPIAHFITEPPMYGDETLSPTQMAYNALAQSFMHWGFLAWAILGSLTGVIFMHLHYDKGLPLKPRTLLYPIFGDKVMKNWFIGYAPLMAMFVARISRGRTIRQMITLIAILAPIVTTFWFTILGGSGLAFEIANPGVITDAFGNFDLPAALFAMIDQLPLSFVVSILFLILTTIFVATTGDSMTFAVSMVMTGTDQPHPAIRIFWGIIMGVMAAILIYMGSGGIGALQSFIVVTAAPVSLILLPTLWVAPRLVRNMAREQGLLLT